MVTVPSFELIMEDIFGDIDPARSVAIAPSFEELMVELIKLAGV